MGLAISIVYIANGSEGTAMTFSALIGMNVLLLFKGDKRMNPVNSAPTINDYVFDPATGIITFSNAPIASQVIQIIYRS